MFRRRNTRTDLEIVATGDFAKIGKQHFRHVSGVEISYDCNRWTWKTSQPTNIGDEFHSLEWAVYQVRTKFPVAA